VLSIYPRKVASFDTTSWKSSAESPEEASRQIPALAKLEKEPKMKAVWKQATKSGNWSTTFRGIGIVIRVDDAGPIELQFFLNGTLDDSAPLSCSLDTAKRIALEAIDRLIPQTPHWRAAANRHDRDSFLRR